MFGVLSGFVVSVSLASAVSWNKFGLKLAVRDAFPPFELVVE